MFKLWKKQLMASLDEEDTFCNQYNEKKENFGNNILDWSESVMFLKQQLDDFQLTVFGEQKTTKLKHLRSKTKSWDKADEVQ